MNATYRAPTRAVSGAWFVRSQRALGHGDVAAAFRHLQTGALAGDPVAMRAIGQLYLQGASGFTPNASEALSWFYEAALRGDAQSMYVLGRAFERGIGVDADPALGHAWLMEARRSGYRPNA